MQSTITFTGPTTEIDIFLWIHKFDILIKEDLPTFDTPGETYTRYAPGITSINRKESFRGLIKYEIETDKATSIREIRAQIANLIEYQATAEAEIEIEG